MLGMKTGEMTFERPEERYEVIILGAGVSGLVSASVLLSQGYRRILIADAYNHVGGNHIDWSTDGYTFDVGSFIFQDDSPLLKHFPELLSRYTVAFPSWGRLNPKGHVTAYPISVKDDIVNAGPVEWIHILASVLHARLFHRKMRNAREFARYWIGNRLLHSSGLDSYMQRFYGVAPDQIDIQLAQKRMFWISEHASLKNMIRRALAFLRADDGPGNCQLVRPKEGFKFLYDAAAERLQESGVVFLLGATFRTIERTGKSNHRENWQKISRSDRRSNDNVGPRDLDYSNQSRGRDMRTEIEPLGHDHVGKPVFQLQRKTRVQSFNSL